MIIVQLQGGLGNQLFQYATAYALSRQIGSSLRIDRSLYGGGSEKRKFQLDKFKINCRVINNNLLKLMRSEKTRFFTNHPFVNVYHQTVCDPIWEELDFNTFGKRLYLKGYWAFSHYFLNHLEYFRNCFQLRDHLATPQYVSIKKFIENRNAVAIHIRRGDYLEKGNSNLFRLLAAEYYKTAITKIKAEVQSPTFIIFSDDVSWAKANLTTAHETVFVADSGVKEDYLEFDLMRRCQHNIISNSTFSWWAALLNENNDKCTIQPARWYNDPGAQRAYESRRLLHIDGASYL
ncbi:alpha-1,2-fucosyltransferase [Flavisolibacter sp. BT320]|nr:alpha-1,2-fucosyltransferase [Flavisolibacter longurius]